MNIKNLTVFKLRLARNLFKITVYSLLLFSVLLLPGCVQDDKSLKIVYTDNNDQGNVFIINDDGTDIKQLTSHGMAKVPCYSADGEKILYIYEYAAVTPYVHIINNKGLRLTSFPLPGPAIYRTTWSPDGRKIAVYQFDGTDGIVLVYSDQGVLINYRNGGNQYKGGITFLTNNELICGRADQSCDIWNFTDDTIKPLAVPGNGNINYAAFSADRRQFLSFYGGPGQVFLTNIDSLTTNLIGSNMNNFIWEHSGKGFYFQHSSDYLYYYSFADNSESKITDFPVYAPSLQCLPR